LNDPKAIAVLEPFAASTVEGPERTAAERALTALRENRPASAELGTLRAEVLNLQKENRDLRKDLDDLKKKLDAVVSPQAPPKKKSSSNAR
jgi:regulator of replication initiation timing